MSKKTENTAEQENRETIEQEAQKTADKKEKGNPGVVQAIKFLLFSISAGVIQTVSFTLMNEILLNMNAYQTYLAGHPGFAKIMGNEYGPIYLIALLLSVVWNFTFNRKFTFKSAANVPIAMLKVLAFYAVFTPLSTLQGSYYAAKGGNFYVILGVTMFFNLTLEFLYDKFVVFRDALPSKQGKESSQVEQPGK